MLRPAAQTEAQSVVLGGKKWTNSDKSKPYRLCNQKASVCCVLGADPNFEIVGESVIPLNDDPGRVVIGGPAILVILVACTMCGYLTHHAQGPLGLTRGQK